jgi:hypothetical protein
MRTLIQLSTSARIPEGDVQPQFFPPCVGACRQFTQVSAYCNRSLYLAVVNQIVLISNPGRGPNVRTALRVNCQQLRAAVLSRPLVLAEPWPSLA